MGFYNNPSCLTGLSYHIFGTDASAIQAVKIKESGLNQIYYNCLTPSSLIPSTQGVRVSMCVCSPQEILLFSHLVFHILLHRPPPPSTLCMCVCRALCTYPQEILLLGHLAFDILLHRPPSSLHVYILLVV